MSDQAKQMQVVKPIQELVGITMTSERLAMALEEETSKRVLIKKYIQTNLVEGTDFGKINMKGRMSKDCLFKPGAEKVCSLLHLKPVFKLDDELIPILGPGVVAFVCELVNRHTGEVEGEGRGSCSLKEKDGNSNVAIKIAQKRAQIDAVLRVAALSDQFTQDLEDMGGETKPTIKPPERNSIPPVLEAEYSDGPPPFDEDDEEAPKLNKLEPATHCTFGKNQGKRWEELSFKSLEWYLENFKEQIEDPNKEQYRASNEAALQGVERALEQKAGM